METVKNRIVIKVGTSTITTETGENNFRTMDKLAQVLLSLLPVLVRSLEKQDLTL